MIRDFNKNGVEIDLTKVVVPGSHIAVKTIMEIANDTERFQHSIDSIADDMVCDNRIHTN